MMFAASVLFSKIFYISYITYKTRLKVLPISNAGIGSCNWERGIFHQISPKSRHVLNRLMTGLPGPFNLVCVEGGTIPMFFPVKRKACYSFKEFCETTRSTH